MGEISICSQHSVIAAVHSGPVTPPPRALLKDRGDFCFVQDGNLHPISPAAVPGHIRKCKPDRWGGPGIRFRADSLKGFMKTC